METTHRLVAFVFVLTGLAACGGGGGGGGGSSVAPANLAYSDADALSLSGVELEPMLPTFDGDVDAFEIAPALPAGLVLDPATGIVAGTPAAPAARRLYTITARNGVGSTTADVRIEIAAPQRFVLVTSPLDKSCASFSVDTAAERLLRGPIGFSGPSDVGPERPVVHPNGLFVYVPHATSRTLSVARLDQATGSVDHVDSLAIGDGPHAAAIDPTGKWLVVANRVGGNVQVFALDATSGAATYSHEASIGTQPSALAFSPSGAQLFLTHAGEDVTGLGSSLVSCTFSAADGTFAVQGSLGLNGSRPIGLAADPRNGCVYATLAMFDALLVVRTSPAGTLTPIAPLRGAGDDPTSIAVDARGLYIFVSAAIDDSIKVFRIENEGGFLFEVGDFPAGDEPTALHCDATGERLFAIARGSSELITYKIEPGGYLTQERSAALRSGSAEMAFGTGVAPLRWTPGFVHCANAGSDDVHSFRVDPTTGALTFTGQTFTDDAPKSLCVDARMRVGVLVADGARTLQSFFVAPSDGALAATGPSVAVAGTPTNVCIAPSGRFAYVTARDVVAAGDGWLVTYAVDATTGALTQVDARESGAGSCYVAIEPTGEYVYVANKGNGVGGSATIAGFHIDAASGIPTAAGTPVFAPGISGLAFHPDGRSVYAILRGSDALARYTIDRASGALTVVPPVAGAGLDPAALAVDPRGRFAWASYTGNAASGEIDVLPIEDGGDLGDVVQQVIDGEQPISLSIDPSGRFLYAANQASHDISVLEVDPETGELLVRAPMLSGVAPTSLVASGSTH